jgi:hypothetical protein
VSGYTVSVGDTTVRRVANFRDARAVVAGAVTDFLADDPEAVARVAMVVNGAFESGAVEHSLIAHGRWSQTVMVQGEPVLMTIVKRRWNAFLRRLASQQARRLVLLVLGLPVVCVVCWLVYGCLMLGTGEQLAGQFGVGVAGAV